MCPGQGQPPVCRPASHPGLSPSLLPMPGSVPGGATPSLRYLQASAPMPSSPFVQKSGKSHRWCRLRALPHCSSSLALSTVQRCLFRHLICMQHGIPLNPKYLTKVLAPAHIWEGRRAWRCLAARLASTPSWSGRTQEMNRAGWEHWTGQLSPARSFQKSFVILIQFPEQQTAYV